MTATEQRAHTGPSILARILVFLVNIYRQWISPFLPPSCRFYPSCSAYAVEALTVHGALRGSLLTVWRLLRCGPWHPGGLDPVPPPRRRAPDHGKADSSDPARPPAEEQLS
ncbi:MAG TPA: membrane protein insertion efficiency factor YidD [Pseudonocardiaceae bacterium]